MSEELESVESWVNDADQELPTIDASVMRPFAWQLLVMPVKPKKKIGSIFIPDSAQFKDEYLTYCGRIVAVGSLCYKHQKYQDMGLTDADRPHVGDWILFPQYNYHRISYKGCKLLALNDDSPLVILGPDADPADFKIER